MTDHSQRRLAAELAAGIVARLDPDAIEWLAEDPIEAIPLFYELHVDVREGGSGEACSVHGSYHHDQQLLVVAQALSTRRTKFTALHELGHHVLRSDEAGFVIADHRHSEVFEEEVCDAIAAAILFYQQREAPFESPDGPTAAEVVALYDSTQASRSACCVRAVQALAGSGYVMLADLEGNARFTASKGTNYRVAKDVPQGHDSIPARAGRSGTARDEGVVIFRSGKTSERMFADAIRAEEYVFAVFTTGPKPWPGLNLLRRQPRRDFVLTCGECLTDFEPGERCDNCRKYVCTICGGCPCQVHATNTTKCQRCGYLKAAHLVDSSGICADCR